MLEKGYRLPVLDKLLFDKPLRGRFDQLPVRLDDPLGPFGDPLLDIAVEEGVADVLLQQLDVDVEQRLCDSVSLSLPETALC